MLLRHHYYLSYKKTGLYDNNIYMEIYNPNVKIEHSPGEFVLRVVIVSSKNLICKNRCRSMPLALLNKKNILSEKYLLYDIWTIKKFKLEITEFYVLDVCQIGKTDILEYLKNLDNGITLSKYSEKALDVASEFGKIHVLEWWKNSGLELKYSTDALDLASCDHYNIDILEWWKNSGLPLKYSADALANASEKSHINIIKWWFNSGLPLKYDYRPIENATMLNNVNVLTCWKESGLPLEYTSFALVCAFKVHYNNHNRGNNNVLEWWKNSGLPLKYEKHHILNYPSKKGCIDILEWFTNSGLEFEYDETPLYEASVNSQIKVLDWWFNSGLPLKYSHILLDTVSSNGLIKVLDWWVNSKLPLEYSEKAIDNLFLGHNKVSKIFEVLEWWKNSKLPIKYSEAALDNASRYSRIELMTWWKNSGLPLKYTKKSIDYAFRNDKFDTLNWWFNSGLPLKYSGNLIYIKEESRRKQYLISLTSGKKN
jgi:hypothetical protein